MHDNLQQKYKISVFQILKMRKAFSNFDFNSTVRKKLHRAMQLFRNKVIERFSLTNHTENPD